jgi:hypothetical protein
MDHQYQTAILLGIFAVKLDASSLSVDLVSGIWLTIKSTIIDRLLFLPYDSVVRNGFDNNQKSR